MEANMKTNLLQLSFIVLLFLCLGGLSGCSSQSSEDTPSVMTLKTSRSDHAVVNDGRYIYVLNGARSGGQLPAKEFTGDLEIVNPQSRSSQLYKDVLIPRKFGTAVFDGDRSIYILGGISINERGRPTAERRVEIFDTVMKTVRFAKSLPVVTKNASAVLVNQRLYVFGDIDSTATRDSQNKTFGAYYDLTNQQWFQVPNVPQVSLVGVIARNQDIYLLGGDNSEKDSTEFLKFSTIENQWQTMPTLPVPASVSAISLSSLNNFEMFHFGDRQFKYRIMKFDFKSKDWQRMPVSSMPYIPVTGAKSTTLNGLIYLIGGRSAQNKQPQNLIQEMKL